MPISNCPFTSYGSISRPILPIKIVNPHANLGFKTFGIIDTGADECAVPASVANILGHNLQAGKTKRIRTGNGETIAYVHTTAFEIFHPVSGEFLYTVKKTPIDYMPNLDVVLLGVNSFLSKFVLNIDYPEKTFSIKYP